MLIVESTFAALPRDPRLAALVADHATSAAPAWVWSADGSRILWANAVAAALFGGEPAACGVRRFDSKHPAAAEIIRLATTLPADGQQRLARLRGFGGGIGRAITCLCARVGQNDQAAVFLASSEPVGPALTLQERVQLLFAHTGKPLIAFTPDGKVLWATAPARAQFAAVQSSTALDQALFDRALTTGSASGQTPRGPFAVERFGHGASAVLVADFDAQSGTGMSSVANNDNRDAPSAAAATSATHAESKTPTAFRGRDELALERRHPLRFVWQMDSEGRFVIGSDEFMELIGPRSTAAFGRAWRDIAADLNLDPSGQIARAFATRETWSGITVLWPVDDGGERLPVELSGLPVFDRDRLFRGYRGFGICRDLDRINHLARARRERPIGFMAPPDAGGAEATLTLPQAEVGVVETPMAEQAPLGKDADRAMPVVGAAGNESKNAATEKTPTESTQADVALVNAGPSAANVVPFRGGFAADTKAPALSAGERKAFRELAEELTARLQGVREGLAEPEGPGASSAEAPLPTDAPKVTSETVAASEKVPAALPVTSSAQEVHGRTALQAVLPLAPALLDNLPLGVLIYRHEASRDVLLYANRFLLTLTGCENLDALAARGGLDKLFTAPGVDVPAEGGSPQALSIVSREGLRHPVDARLVAVPWDGASALALIMSNGDMEERRQSHALSLESARGEIRELKAHVEAFKKTEAEMRAATREAQKAAAAKAEFVAKISHEIRTPLNAMTGFTEVIMGERFGPIGNERYREYLKDIHDAGLHVVSLLNDLLDLSKIENGQLDLSFANVSLNELTQQCVGIMQPQASRARIIIRTSLTPGLPQVVADERSLRQIVLNLLSNSIKFTGPGGQVIVSTAFADNGEAVLRVRDTGMGMSEKDVEAALEPFRQTATAGSWGSGGTGLGLPLTKALAEANRAHFSIKSAPNAGTLIEVAFPPTRIAR
jgi:signal transduction histidine kinase